MHSEKVFDLMNFDVAASTKACLPAYISLLEEASEWLWNKGIQQWQPGTHKREHGRILNLVDNGYLILAHHQGRLAGGCVLSYIAPDFWAQDLHAIYLYSLVVARFASGKGVGSAIIRNCSQLAREKDISAIRLDCWDGNKFLRSYYQKAGFEMRDRVREKDYWVRPFEMKIRKGTQN